MDTFQFIDNITKLFLGGIPHEADEAEISKILSRVARIISIKLKRRKDNPNGKCLGHGVIETTREGSKKLLALRKFYYGERQLVMTPFLEGDALS